MSFVFNISKSLNAKIDEFMQQHVLHECYEFKRRIHMSTKKSLEEIDDLINKSIENTQASEHIKNVIAYSIIKESDSIREIDEASKNNKRINLPGSKAYFIVTPTGIGDSLVYCFEYEDLKFELDLTDYDAW